MKDIHVNAPLARELIESLRQKNNAVKDEVGKVIEALELLDESKWQSPEKEKITNELLPYLKKVNSNYPDELNECTSFLSKAVEKYEELDRNRHNRIERNTSLETYE